MEQEHEARVRRLQERIAAALREDVEATRESDFSEYMPDASTPLTDLLARAAQAGGGEGIKSIEAALDEFERLAASEDLPRLQHALMVFLSQHPAATQLGLRVPPLSERSPSQVLPNRRDD
jgi:hypothetical protein